MLRSIFNFLLFSSIYISLCAVLMVWQTNTVLNLHYDYFTYNAFVFFSTICSYNFHWYLTPAEYSTSQRILWGARHRTMQLAFCAIGAIGALVFFWQLKQHWLPLAGAAMLTFLYSAPKLPYRLFVWLRTIAVGKTLFLTFVWTYVSTPLPVFIAGAPITPAAILLTLHRFFLIYAICILFDYRDVESDKKEGIRSLITILSDRQLFWIYYIALLMAALCALLLWPFTTPVAVATLLVPVVVTGLLTRNARHNRSDYMYYFVLDGLMMLSALLHLLISLNH
ncbi:MAG TPA: UbiA family prenyltransferase [Chitinophaga sp.]|uniref:UbiA family prenyltransferase n=1 Tax=Chitinophaga sp. TaxID=1869181 RepID=UPI002DB57679|nr:UbiA family prenyltransferase [Chitinophaga sp.]HEU4554213.1 UbiA family prenyltransferase [Chitinophaga sp.]